MILKSSHTMIKAWKLTSTSEGNSCAYIKLLFNETTINHINVAHFSVIQI